MSEFDPFGGGDSSKNYDNNKKSESKKLDPKTTGLIKKIITIIIILGVIGIITYFLFFNTVDVTINVKDTENKNINAPIEIRKVSSNKSYSVASGETIKLNKSKEYTYTINVPGYKQVRKEPLDLTEPDLTVILIKSISLDIVSFSCPTQVFLGQRTRCEMQLKNTSTESDYNIDLLTFSGDVSNWNDFKNKTYDFLDSYGEELPELRKKISPTSQDVFFVYFNVPTDKNAIGNKRIKVRVLGTDTNKDTNFSVLESPIITFTSTITSVTKMISGDEITKIYNIDNSKNKIALDNLLLSVDANYNPTDANVSSNFDVNGAFEFDFTTTSVEASSRSNDGTITITLPNTLRKGEITGKLLLSSTMFDAPKEISFKIIVEEPLNAFEISLNKTSETLTYDSNTNTTTTKNIDLILNNKNSIPVHINSLSIVNSTGTTDCNNWITIPSIFNNYNLQQNETQTAPIALKGTNLSALTAKDTRNCAINIEYIQPYTQETITTLKSITINVN